MDPMYWTGSIGITIALGFLFGRKIDKSHEFAKWLGIGIVGYWLIWTLALSSIFAVYILYGNLAIYPATFIAVVFFLNHLRMRRSRKTEELIADVEKLDNELLENQIETVIKDRIDVLQAPEDHRKKFINTLRTADQTVVILSGWTVNYVAKKEFKTLLAGCLKRGVMVYIGYGYQKPGTKRVDKEVEQEARQTLDKLVEWCVKKKSEGRLEVFFYPSHSNALIKDDKYAIVGGFNWLSDNGTSEIGERSWIVSSRDFVIRERDKIVMGR